MGVMLDSTNTNSLSGKNTTYNSGFKGGYGEGGSNTTGASLPESKYYDTYRYSTSESDFSRFIYGDATGELGPFGESKYGTLTRQIKIVGMKMKLGFHTLHFHSSVVEVVSPMRNLCLRS